MPSGNPSQGGSPFPERPETEADLAGTPPTGAAAATVADLEEFRRALVEHGLVTDEELAHFTAATPPGEGVLELARTLVTAGKLTAYQSAALYQRKGRSLVIGHYLILDKLGAGGMGMVFKAKHRRLGTVVALKILPPSFARDRQAVLRFQREVEAASRLDHPNIVAALDAAEDRGVDFLVMEYVQGHDLDRVVRERGPMRVGEAVDCLIQAARGLAAAHAQRIVHRDVKPSNLMLDAAGTVRVLDLGLALIADSSNPFGQTAATRLTASGMYMGTVDYMAPEQAKDSKRADHRADIYSLGCTLFYLLTGREPFVAETVLKRLMAHLERPAPSLRAARPDVPTPLEQAYQKMMAKRPADRPASMTAVIASGSEPERDRRIPWAGAARRPAQVFAPAEGLPRDTPERPASRRTTRSSSWTPPAGGQPARIPPMSRPRRRSSRSPRPTRRSCLRPARASPAAGNASRPACRGWSTWGRFPTAMTSRPMHWLWSIRARSARSSF